MNGVFSTFRKKITVGRGILVVGMLGIIMAAFVFKGVNVIGLLATATSSLSASPTVLYFTPYGDRTLQVGEDTSIDVNVNARVAINALGVTIKYPPDLIEVVAFSKQKSFLDLWTEDTTIRENAGEVHFSGGTTMRGGLIGTSTAITLTIEAKKPGTATISFEDVEALASDGTGTELESTRHSITYTIPAPAQAPTVTIAPPTVAGAIALPNTVSAPAAPNADLNGDHSINLIDMSLLMLHMIGAYDPRYDLNMDGVINIADLSILFSKMGSKK